jgi:hypothetical protein
VIILTEEILYCLYFGVLLVVADKFSSGADLKSRLHIRSVTCDTIEDGK